MREELRARSRLVQHFSRARMGCCFEIDRYKFRVTERLRYDSDDKTSRGISQISNRYGKSNNKCLSDDKFDSNTPSTFVTYLDANNLYGWAMSKPLPTNGFKWMSDDELNNWRRTSCI